MTIDIISNSASCDHAAPSVGLLEVQHRRQGVCILEEKPPNVTNESEAPTREGREGRFRLRACDLGRAVGSVNVGLQRFVVEEGYQSLPEHYHMAEEELFYVLKGKGTLLQAGERILVEAGDVISYPAGTEVSHAFLADKGEQLEYLAFGERNTNDVVVYPRSDKILIRSVGFLGRLGEEADYFDGESV